jgi:hypothetical protein
MRWIGSVALLLAAGCQTADGHRWTMPWEKPVAKEEIVVPPMADARYTEPQSLPKSAMRSGLATKPASEPGKPPTAGPMTSSMPGMPGAMGRPGMGGY